MANRRDFLKTTTFSSFFLFLSQYQKCPAGNSAGQYPLVISTWGANQKANAEAWKILYNGGRAVDAVERGVQIPEADPSDQSVGFGGLPDRDGKVTLDACIMDEYANCGSVMFLEGVKHPIQVARKVMEKTPHIQLVGEGALQFALENGFKVENLLTPKAEKAWQEWLKHSEYDPMTIPKLLEKQSKPGQQDNHDTIGMLAIDVNNNLSGACTTSGMAFKMRGRVGDSPIIGAGLFVDNEIGAATATGVGEEVLRICGSHTVVELMRQGLKPGEACKKAVERIANKRAKAAKDIQVGLIAVNKKGEYGGYALQPGFSYAVQTKDASIVINAESKFN
jgi:N4-(beta-N-acetylglucosaminyl)-L-asparaginase